MSLKKISSGALTARLFSGAEPFMQFLKESCMANFHVKLHEIGPVVQEDMLFKEKVYGRWTTENARWTPDED